MDIYIYPYIYVYIYIYKYPFIYIYTHIYIYLELLRDNMADYYWIPIGLILNMVSAVDQVIASRLGA